MDENVYQQGKSTRAIGRGILRYWWLVGGSLGAIFGIGITWYAKVLIEWLRHVRQDAMWPM